MVDILSQRLLSMLYREMLGVHDDGSPAFVLVFVVAFL